MAQAWIFIPILISLGFFVTVFGIIYLRNKERMAMIERGMDPRSYKAQPAPYQNLKWGLLMVGAGLGLLLAFFLGKLMGGADDNPAPYFSLIAIFGGAGLILSYRIEKKEVLDKPLLQD